MLQKIRGQSFLIGLALAVCFGFWGNAWLSPVASIPWLKTAIVLTVMSMMAAPVPLELFVKTVSRPWPGLLASIICLGLTPILGWVSGFILQSELGGGLIVACCVPSTLASSAVITRKAGGDDTVPIFVTILTNLSCVFITPMWLVLLMGSNAKLSVVDLIRELAVLVVLPIVAVQIVRWRSPAFCHWAKQAKSALSAACQVGILMMVSLGAIQMGSRWFDPDSTSTVTVANVVVVVVIGLAIHLICLYLGAWLAKSTGVARPQAIGVAFAGSQKTLMIGINLAIDYGVSILPMISYHVSQLLVDAFIAESWNRAGQQDAEKQRNLTQQP